MKNYIELAHRSSAPIEGPTKRLEEQRSVASLRDLFCGASLLGDEADGFKRSIFYGKGDLPTPCGYFIPEEQIKRAIDPKMVELIHAGIGMLTEACEFLQALRANVIDGQPLDETLLKEEIGDGQWYHAKACKFLGTTIEAEQERNIAKLKKRYPEKFTEDHASNRNLPAEREVLDNHVISGGEHDVVKDAIAQATGISDSEES